MKVTIKESSTVRPSEDTPNRRLWLSNLDLLFPPYYTPAAYVYKSDGSPNFFDTKLLKESLSKVLVTFYPLAGRLVTDENGRREVHCNGDGVLFLEAATDCPLCDYADFAAFWDKLLPQVDPGRHFSSCPLLLLQVTKFSCGGALLGYMLHHNVADGAGSTHFFNSWSELTRGQPISVPPVFDRSFLRARDPPTPKFHHVEYDPPPTFEIQNGPQTFPSLIKIPMDLITLLKSKVNKEDCQVKYSTFEILTAHLWRCSTQVGNLNSDQVTTLRISIDGRNRLNPALPQGYCGNVIFVAKSVVLVGELLAEPLIKTIQRIRNALKQMNNDYLRSAIDYIEKKSDQLLQHRPENHSMIRTWGTLNVVSWVTLPIFNADFGWGRPINMLSPNIFEGVAIFLPCFSGENDLPLIINVLEEDKKSIENLLHVLEVNSKI